MGLKAINKAPPTDIAFINPIQIGNNVFIGMNVLITPGVVIDDHVVIGAGSVLRGHIPAYSVVAGNPAVIVGDLKVLALKWSDRMGSTELRVDNE